MHAINTVETSNIPESNPERPENVSGKVGDIAGNFSIGGLGAMAVEMPGMLPKVAGVTAMAYSLKKGVDISRVESGAITDAEIPSVFSGIRNRAAALGRSLIDKTTGKVGLVSRLKRNLGEDIVLSAEDAQFRNRFRRLLGSTAMTGLGAALLERPSGTAQLTGVAIMSAGMTEQATQYQKVADRKTELLG